MMQPMNVRKWREAAKRWYDLADDEMPNYLTEATLQRYVSAAADKERVSEFMDSEEGKAALELLDAAEVTLVLVHFFQVSPRGAFRRSLMFDCGGFFYHYQVMVLEPGKEMAGAQDVFLGLTPEEVETVLCPYRTVHRLRAELNFLADAAPS